MKLQHAELVKESDKGMLVKLACEMDGDPTQIEVWFPKSQAHFDAQGEFICASWLVAAKEQELSKSDHVAITITPYDEAHPAPAEPAAPAGARAPSVDDIPPEAVEDDYPF